MRIAVLGAGLIGRASAAYLVQQGHAVGIWSPSGKSTAGLLEGGQEPGRGLIRYRGAISGEARVDILNSPAEFRSYEVLLVALPGDAYENVLPAALPHIDAGHFVIVSGALSLVPLWIHEQAGGGRARPVVASWGTTLLTARRGETADVEIATVRAKFDVACVPARAGDEALARCRALFGDRFDAASSILATALSNVNPVAHAAEALPNLTRMERGEAWHLFECMTPAAARIAEAIDAERLALAQSFGLRVRSLSTHYHLSYHVPLGTIAEMAAAIHARDHAPHGPKTAAHRYVLEDIPYGLVFYEALARIAGVQVPVMSAAVTLASAAYGRDFRRDNALITSLGLEQLTPARLLERCAG